MKKCTKVEELKDNENKFKASNKYTETQKKVILRAISEKILELEKKCLVIFRGQNLIYGRKAKVLL